MTHSIEKVVFFGIGFLGRSVAVAGLLALASCSTASIEDAAPVATAPTQPNLVGPRDTGSYPNLNIPPQQAAPQFTDEQARAKLDALNAENAAAQNPARAAARRDSASLNALARSHGSDALKQIEGKCDPALDPTCK